MCIPPGRPGRNRKNVNEDLEKRYNQVRKKFPYLRQVFFFATVLPVMQEKRRKVVFLSWPTEKMAVGVRRFTPTRNWMIEVLPPNDDTVRELESQPPDGVIAYLGTEKYMAWAAEQAFPVFNHSSALLESTVPRVHIDDMASGRLAAEYLISQGHRNLAYIGYSRPAFSSMRYEGFRAKAESCGIEVQDLSVDFVLAPQTRQQSPRRHQQMLTFLRKLPKPVGLFTCNDPLGFWAIDCAKEIGANVPDELAVVGMDNDVLCRLSYPPMSSIDPPFEKVAYEAAAMLQKLMDGDTVSERDVAIAPTNVVARMSSDTLAIEDPKIAAATRYLRENYQESLTMGDVAKHVGVNRRELERKFDQFLGHSPLQELQRVRIHVAKELLIDTRLSLAEVSNHAGFDHPQWFSTLFKKVTGKTPSQYRKDAQ